MTAKELIEKSASQVASFFEKAIEIRFFLHLLCVALYIELGLFVAFKKPVFLLTWVEFEYLSPGEVVALVLGYFALMGYVLRLLYVIVVFCLRFSITYLPPNKTRWSDVPGMVHSSKIICRAYQTKDNELIRQLETHKELCKRDRNERRELAYLAFVSLILIALNESFVVGNVLDEGAHFVSGFLSKNSVQIFSVILLLPLIFLIWLDASDDYSQDEYMRHDPLYQELEEEKRKEKETLGY